MRYFIVLVFGCLLIFWSCLSTRTASHEVREIYPTFYIGQHSWYAMIFRDSTLLGQSFSDGGGMMSNIFPVGNWRFINDSTLLCYNLKGRKKDSTVRTYYLDRISPLMQVLVPEQSLPYYRDTLQTKVRAWILANPYVPAKEDSFLIKADSTRFHTSMARSHYKSLINKYAREFNDLNIYQGKGF
jgi:hypothetical protein